MGKFDVWRFLFKFRSLGLKLRAEINGKANTESDLNQTVLFNLQVCRLGKVVVLTGFVIIHVFIASFCPA